MKKKISKKNRVRKAVIAVLCIALLFCPVFAFADETTDHTEPQETAEVITWTDITDRYTPTFDNQGMVQKVITGYDFATGVDNVLIQSAGLSEENFYSVKWLYVYFDVVVKQTVKLFHNTEYPIIRFICSTKDDISYTLPSGLATYGTYQGVEIYDTEISSTASTGYASRFSRAGNAYSVYHYFISDQDKPQYTTDRYDIKTHIRGTIKYDLDAYLTALGGNSSRDITDITNAVGVFAKADAITISDTASISSYTIYGCSDSLTTQLVHLDKKLYELNECTDDIYHELYSLHTRMISMHTTLSQLLTVSSNFASTTNTQLSTIISLLSSDNQNDFEIYRLLMRTFEDNPSALASSFDAAIEQHESHEEVAVSAIESAAPIVDQQIEQLKGYDTRSFWETNRTAATFWKTVLNKFFDNTVLGVIASFLIIINIILLVKFILRL